MPTLRETAEGMTKKIDTTNSETDTLVGQLIKKFQQLHDEPPEWAWPFPPSIPFVGNEYERGRGLLIYASAENFSWMNKNEAPARFNSEAAWNRYRAAYEEEGRYSSGFFPSVGIQPVTDGGLLAAGLFVADRLGMPTDEMPRTFLETLAVSNWCKFTVESDRNVDYIRNAKKLRESLSFVITELATLRPRIALIPKPVWAKTSLSSAMKNASPNTIFFPIHQFNTTVVNCHLGRFDTVAQELRRISKGDSLAEWMEHLVGFNIPNAWRYLVFVEKLLEKNYDLIERSAARDRILYDIDPQIVKKV